MPNTAELLKMVSHNRVELPNHAVPISTALLNKEVQELLTLYAPKQHIVFAFENKVFVRMPNQHGAHCYHCVSVATQ